MSSNLEKFKLFAPFQDINSNSFNKVYTTLLVEALDKKSVIVCDDILDRKDENLFTLRAGIIHCFQTFYYLKILNPITIFR